MTSTTLHNRQRHMAPLLAALALGPALPALAQQTPVQGGTLTLAAQNNLGCIDPQQASLEISLGEQIGDSLLAQDLATHQLHPHLASSWEVNDNATEFTFHIREGVTFSDGTPLDAQSVKTNFDGIIGLGALATLASGYLQGYAGSEVLDSHTVVVRFEAPNAGFLSATATGSLAILSEATWAQTPEARCTGAYWGSGPFVLSRYVDSDEAVIERRPDYAWPPAHVENQGAAYLERVVYKIITDASVAAGSLRTGQIDGIINARPLDHLPLQAAGLQLLPVSPPGITTSLYVNTDRPVARDPAIRRAVQIGFDREALRDTLFSAFFPVATSILTVSTSGYQDFSALLAYDPEGAIALLEAAGWQPGPDGIRQRDGQRATLEFLVSPGDGFRDVGEFIQASLREIGLEVTLRVNTWVEIFPIRAAGEYDYTTSALLRADPDVLRRDFWSGALPNAAGRPHDAALDALLEQQVAIADLEARNAVVAEAQRLILEEGYGIPYIGRTTVNAFAADVRGVGYNGSSRLQYHGIWRAAN